MHRKFYLMIAGLLMAAVACRQPLRPAIVFQTDFGLKDGAVSEMKGVAMQIDPSLKLYDLTHEIPAFDTWVAAYRLQQTAPFWPKGTVFVSVVDPGVGTARKSIVMKSGKGQFFVTPDNGTLTLVAETDGIEAVRIIDENRNRRPGSSTSNTFHGRDVYAYTAARLAAGVISFEEVGPLLSDSIVRLPYQHAIVDSGKAKGTIPVLDVQYGNVWTNVPDSLFAKLHLSFGDSVDVVIFKEDMVVFRGMMPYSRTFGDVPGLHPLLYANSLMNMSIALNLGNFADSFNIGSGAGWRVELKKAADHEMLKAGN